MELENMNIWCWIIPLLVGLICGVLGYLIGKGGSASVDHSSDLLALKDKNARLQLELDSCNQKLLSNLSAIPAVAVAFDALAARSAFGKRIKEDDLKLIEGIGPKIEGLFHNFDIKSWKQLSETSVSKCQEVLDSGGDRYKIHDPASWPMQAKMAYEGKWKALYKWQVQHKHGKL